MSFLFSSISSKKLRPIGTVGLTLFQFLWVFYAMGDITVIPLLPDPPPALDGQLDEWSARGKSWGLEKGDAVVWGKDNWTGPEDLTGTVWLGWDRDNLYVAARIRDDHFSQQCMGRDAFKGDHVILFLHLGSDGKPPGKKDAVLQLGLSPGNFQTTGDPLADIPPEIVTWHPPDRSIQGTVAARRSGNGYDLEAALPWKGLHSIQPKEGLRFGVDLCPSDCDAPIPCQETLFSLVRGPWRVRDPERLVSVALGNADGEAPDEAAQRGLSLLKHCTLAPGETREVIFSWDPGLHPDGEGRPLLSLSARLQSPKLAGGTNALALRVNGTELDAHQLANKDYEFSFQDGRIIRSWGRSGYFLYYSPDHEEPEKGKSPYCPIDAPATRFELLLDGFLKQGENLLEIRHGQTKIDNPLVVEDLRLCRSKDAKTLEEREEERAAPQGALPVYEPREDRAVSYSCETSPQGLLIALTNRPQETFSITSRFSHPGQKWLSLEETKRAELYTLSRKVSPLDECVVVEDTFKSTGIRDVPIMVRHEAAPHTPLKGLYLGGLKTVGLSGQHAEPANPTTLLLTEKTGLGLMAEDDVFRVHVTNYCTQGVGGLADNQFVLRKGTSYTFRWTLFPLETPDYFAFVNRARRRLGTNFRIDGSFFFANYRKPFDTWNVERCEAYASYKGAKYICAGIVTPKYQGKYAHGTAFPLIDHSLYPKLFDKFKRGKPDLMSLVYFHCFISTEEGASEKYADSRLLKPDGTQGNYRNPIYPIFIPMETNSYGAKVSRNVEIILEEIGADGVYWDELAYSAYRYHFGEPWDGFSADIDPKTMDIVRTKSSVTLLTQPWRQRLVQRIMRNGKLLIGNGNPTTSTFTQFHFPRFIETGSITNLCKGHLYTPIALGDHLTERTELDAYRNMLRALDYGSVYYWYHESVIPTHPTLTSFQFPITPIELHEGYILGEERILTNRSGVFGWGDSSTFECHLFDRKGFEVTDPSQKSTLFKEVTLKEYPGNTFAEVRIPQGFSAAIVRKQATIQ